MADGRGLDAVLRGDERRPGGVPRARAQRDRGGGADLLPARKSGAGRGPRRGHVRGLAGLTVTEWEAWRQAGSTFITLHTRDAFDAAIFYGQVLDWASGIPGCCEVEYAGGGVLLRHQGDIVARIESGAVEAPPDPSVRPHWQVHFAVPEVEPCARAAEHHGGSVLYEGEDEAVLRDPDGAQFTVTSHAAALTPHAAPDCSACGAPARECPAAPPVLTYEEVTAPKHVRN